MNCDECKNLISVFLDSDLEESTAAAVRMHLALCSDCERICADFASILDVVSEGPSIVLPPNSQALWCRINNIIENDIKPGKVVPPPEPQAGRFWRFSFGQLAAAVLCIAMVSSLATVVAVRSYFPPEPAEFAVRSSTDRTLLDKMLGRLGLAETPQQMRERRLKQHQEAIDYWNARVQTRRMKWDDMTRDAFERNLRVIDQSVNEFSVILQRNPDDDLSGEMLDSVMDDKMKLLRDFADL
ncbi:hypothetical protein BH20ACI2_BH20ACI2_10830 [soil metagenome]